MSHHRSFSTHGALESARQTLSLEAQAIMEVHARLDDSFTRTVEALLSCKGRVVVSGLGKTGHIARKIAATLASTGTPSFFLHAAEAVHGDLGMMTADDILVAISYSGSGNELLTIVPVVKRMGAKLIAMTGNPSSELAQQAYIHLDVSVQTEACPLNLAPTSSTTVALAMGDALAVACLQARGFGSEDFARSHPGGALGRKLLTHVRDVMRSGSALPTAPADLSIARALEVMSSHAMGMAIVVDAHGRAQGVFTDGDLRRLIERVGDIRGLILGDHMTPAPHTIGPNALAAEAALRMDELKLSQMLVQDDKNVLVGALHMHDLMAAKVI
ncbi:MAG: KpsF/GutQ family sugar-phosphate isomerase [Burkholderiaceae bacterium]